MYYSSIGYIKGYRTLYMFALLQMYYWSIGYIKGYRTLYTCLPLLQMYYWTIGYIKGYITLYMFAHVTNVFGIIDQ